MYNEGNQKLHHLKLFFIIIILKIRIILSETSENYISNNLEGEEGNYLLDVVDYHNLHILLSTSGNIYTGIPPTYKIHTNANINNCSSVATVNENYIFVSCLSDSLLGKININTGDYSSLIQYTDIQTPFELTVPSTICSLSIFNNLVFIGYTKMNTNDNNKTNIVISANILNKENDPSIELSNDKTFFIFPRTYYKTTSIRQIGCDVVNHTDNSNIFRLVCVYDNYDSNNKYQIYSFSIKNDLSSIDTHDEECRVYGFTADSGFRLYKVDSFYLRCIMRKIVRDLYTTNYQNNIIVRGTGLDIFFLGNKDLFDYNNNFIFSSGRKNSKEKYFTINKYNNETRFYKIFDFLEEKILKIIGFYDQINDYIMIVSQYSSFIKYYIIKNSNNICQINNYTGILKISTNDITVYNIEDFLDYYSDFNNINFKEIFLYETLSQTFTNYSIFYEGSESNRVYFLSNSDFFLKSCSSGNGQCSADFYKCDNCNSISQNNKCFSVENTFEGYLHDSNGREKCYKTCQFCAKSEALSSSSDHNCESCIEGYMPSYKFLGNCYKIPQNYINSLINVNSYDDEAFTQVEACPKYSINSTKECVDECPNENKYYSFNYSNLDFSKYTNNTLSIKTYKKLSIIPPKYLFNKICFESCPPLTKLDNDNKCKCKFAFNIINEITICYEVDYCKYNLYKYYLDDTKECISRKECPSEYYQFNFQCYKNGCPSETTEYPENSHKCISIHDFCYINEHFQTLCNLKNETYIYKFDNTVQYLRSCEDSLIYTTEEEKTYFLNNTCYLNCPVNTKKDNITNMCVCKYYKYNLENNNYICYSEEEICNDKVPVIDLKICLNNINECKLKDYKLFNNECYSNGCPSNTKLNESDGFSCICYYYYYKYNNNTLNCFEESISCEDNNYSFYNPDSHECFNSLEDCFSKNNLFYFNNFCYKNECPNGKIALSSTNETIQNYFIKELSLNFNLKDNICICDFINSNIYWNKTEKNEIKCLEKCEDYYEPEPLTHKCIEKCNPNKHFNFNDQCYIDNCPNGTKLNLSEMENDKKICICNDLYYINKTNNFMICCNENNMDLCLKEIQTIETTIFELPSTEPPSTETLTNEPPPTEPPSTEPPSTETLTNEPPSTETLTNESPLTEPPSTEPQSTETLTNKPPSTEPSTNKPPTNEPPSTEPSTNEPPSTETPSTEPLSTEPPSTAPPSIDSSSTESKDHFNGIEIIYPEEYYKEPNNCIKVYNNECYSHCPEGTCLTPNDINLVYCVPIETGVVVFNDICFTNLDEIISNLKNMSENNHTFSISPKISINIYTKKTTNSVLSEHSNLSIIYLNECETLLLDYYNLTNDTILYIIGIDSPNKNTSYVVNVYNYGVFLESGYQLDHLKVCKDSKITISSPIKDSSSIKLDEASYFSDLGYGYDIYDKNNSFYNDRCAPASIDGNDITLSDRVKDFYPSNYNLCNDSCKYNSTDLVNQRFICICDLNYNYSDNENNNESEEEDITYKQYFLSLFNYKIVPCYKLLFDSENYKFNIGFFISAGTIIICIIEMIIFMIFGILKLKKEILLSIPNKEKLRKKLKNKKSSTKKTKKEIVNHKIKKNKNIKKEKDAKNVNYFNIIYINQNEKNNPPKKNNNNIEINKKKNDKKIKEKNKNKIKKEKHKKDNKDIIKNNEKDKRKKTNKKIKISNNELKKSNNLNLYNINESSKNYIMTNSKNNIYKVKNRKRFFELSEFGNDKSIDKKEINHVPYTQALRIDNRDWLQMFLSILANEIKIISIFYYKNPLVHLSLTTSIYLFESLLDLTLNCFLYTDDYISEKYNNGNLKFITSILLSLMSNIFSSIITYYVIGLVEYTELLEMIMNQIVDKKFYFLNIAKFKKYLVIKLCIFYSIQTLLSLCMCYYLTIFCIIYHQTQGSIMINYLTGIAQSLIISLVLSLFTSFLRYASIKNRIKYLYNTSKYLFEKF